MSSCTERYCCPDKNDSVCEDAVIELLCDDVLLQIFGHLTAKDLKYASLVNRRWNELIGSSTITMKKFVFPIRHDSLQLSNFGSNRNHQNYVVRIDDSTDWPSIAGNIQLERVKMFHIQRTRFCETIGYEVVTFLSRLKQLEILSLEGVRLIDCDESTELVSMSKIKSVQINGNDFTILKHIDVNNLQDLQCFGRGYSNVQGFESIAYSILRYSNLKRLILWNCMESFEYINVPQLKCKLNSIAVYHINVDPIDVRVFADNFLRFLAHLVDNLEDLRFDFSMFDVEEGRRIVDDLLQIAFNQCTKLKSLDIRNLSISRDKCFYQRLSPNVSVKNLKVHWGFDGEVIEGLLRKCPNIEKLEADLCHLNGDGITCIANLCEELINLDTFKLIGNIGSDVVFGKLEYLSIVRIEHSFDPLMALLAKCPVIKQIRIHECSNPELLPMDLIISQNSIRKLVINDKCYDIYVDKDKRKIVERQISN